MQPHSHAHASELAQAGLPSARRAPASLFLLPMNDSTCTAAPEVGWCNPTILGINNTKLHEKYEGKCEEKNEENK